MNLPFRKTFADQFFGVTWDAGTEFYIAEAGERCAIKGKVGGNAMIVRNA